MHRTSFLTIVVLLSAASFAASPYIPITGTAFHIEPADVNGDGTNEIVYATYQETVGCVDPVTHEILWETPIGGFPFELKARDATRDGVPEIYCACADGNLYCFDHTGATSWTFTSEFPMYAVDMGWVGTGTARAPVIACGGPDLILTLLSPTGTVIATYSHSSHIRYCAARIVAHDMDGDGEDEFLVRDGHRKHALFDFNGTAIQNKWHDWLEFGTYRLSSYDTLIGDINDDDMPEIVHSSSHEGGHQSLGVFASNKTYLTKTTELGWATHYDTQDDFYCTPFMGLIDLLPDDPGPEIITVAGGTLRVFSFESKYYNSGSQRYDHALRLDSRLAFTDLKVDGDILYLGSTPNGDQTIYRLDLSTNTWQAEFEDLERQGVPAEIHSNLTNLTAQALSYNGTAPERGTYVFSLARPSSTWGKNACKVQAHWLTNAFPYQRADGSFLFEYWGRYVGLNLWYTGPQISNIATDLEAQDIPFVLSIAHGTDIFTDLYSTNLAELLVAVAPSTFKGFVISEDGAAILNGTNLFVWYHGPLLEWCAANGRTFTIAEKATWWLTYPARQVYFDALFSGDRGRAISATAEDSNSRTPELNTFGRFGLYQAGLIERAETRALGDNFCANRFFEWETPRHGHPHFRLMACHTLLGGGMYEPRFGPLYNNNKLNVWGEESIEVLFHLIGKGLIFKPKPHEMIGMCPVGLAIHEPSSDWLKDAENLHGSRTSWPDTPALHNAVIPYNGNIWGYTRTADHALQKVWFHKDRQFGTHVPATPYGPCAIVPTTTDLSNVVGVTEWWHTDGTYLWRDGGPKLQGTPAAAALEASLEAAASNLPFRVHGDDVFFHVLDPDFTNHYMLYAIDPGWLDPRDRHVTAEIQLPGVMTIVDPLTQEILPVSDSNTFAFTVPAGAIRILEAHPIPEPVAGGAVCVLLVLAGRNTWLRFHRSTPPEAEPHMLTRNG